MNKEKKIQEKKLDSRHWSKLKKIIASLPPVASIVDAIDRDGGRALLVGGAVRDLLLGVGLKDLDIEVHNLSLEQLKKNLKKYGPVSLVGASYGVLRLHGLDVDWSVPRKEGAGRKPKVTFAQLSIRDAFARRDLTINAIGIDLKTGVLLDPFGGVADLKKKVLRATDARRFVEDPLRFYRVMQFAARFEMKPDRTLDALCKKMKVNTVSVERVDGEFRKLFLKSKKPSLGFLWLKKIGRLKDLLPELYATIDVVQGKKWHPEGDVFEHTMQSIDAAAMQTYADDAQKLLIMYAALCHDLGKAVSTTIGDEIHSYGHSLTGIPLAKKLLKRITRNKELVAKVCLLIKHHMAPGQLVKSNAGPAAYKRLANKLAPVTLADLALLARADHAGRSPKKGSRLRKKIPIIDQFLARAQKASVLDQVEKPILLGRDLLDIVSPGPEMGRLLKKAYELQLRSGITSKAELKKRVLK